MKSIMISIQPKWCELIANGKKTIEVRKTMPKIETPFKCYIYCTSVKSIPIKEYVKIHQTTGGKIDDWHGKVIGEFICTEITEFESEFWDDKTYERIQKIVKDSEDYSEYGEYEYITIATNEDENYKENWLCKQSCVSWEEMRKYIGSGIKEFYGWHISDLVIYYEPNELYEFYSACKNEAENDCSKFIDDGKQSCFGLKRPPQSWCYVEEANENDRA